MYSLQQTKGFMLLMLVLSIFEQAHMDERTRPRVDIHLKTNITKHFDAKFDALKRDFEELKSHQTKTMKLMVVKAIKIIREDLKSLHTEPKCENALLSIEDLLKQQQTKQESCKLSPQLLREFSEFKNEIKNLKTLSHTAVAAARAQVKEVLHCDKNLRTLLPTSDTVASTNCQQAMSRAKSTTNGAYVMKLPNAGTLLSQNYCAYCHYAESGGWLLIQRRKDGTENFKRTWQDYETGFGDVRDEFWLGLERIHQITKEGNYELWILLRNVLSNVEGSAYYKHFKVAGKHENYKLTISGYSGDAGDSMSYHNGSMFSTYDKDNDESRLNCAKVNRGGWWYKDCFNANLNGVWSVHDKRHGIQWLKWPYVHETMKYVHMAIRPVK